MVVEATPNFRLPIVGLRIRVCWVSDFQLADGVAFVLVQTRAFLNTKSANGRVFSPLGSYVFHMVCCDLTTLHWLAHFGWQFGERSTRIFPSRGAVHS